MNPPVRAKRLSNTDYPWPLCGDLRIHGHSYPVLKSSLLASAIPRIPVLLHTSERLPRPWQGARCLHHATAGARTGCVQNYGMPKSVGLSQNFHQNSHLGGIPHFQTHQTSLSEPSGMDGFRLHCPHGHVLPQGSPKASASSSSSKSPPSAALRSWSMA